jgi:hypothetical protein
MQMSLQSLTIAMSLGGIQYLFQTTLQPSIVSALQKMTMPAPSINLPSPLLFNPGQGAAAAAEPGWPPMHFPTYWAVNASVSLSNGSLENFSPTFQEITQGTDGEFTVKMSAENLVVDYNWNESYDEQKCAWDGSPREKGCIDQGQQNNSYQYKLGIGTWSIVIVFKFQYSANGWQLSLVSANSTTDNLSPNIPSNSVVHRTGEDLCFKPAIVTNAENALKNIDFSGAVKGALEQVFKTIPKSGQITPDIAFDFSMGPSGITFPNSSGLATGVVGTATWKGTVYPGTNPPQLKLPQVPTSRHLSYYISDYSINALFWAFFSAGLLETLATEANTGGNSSLLNTRTFMSSPAQVIYDKYPNAPMTANINALSAPTVAIQQVYEPTAQALNKCLPPLPKKILDELQGMEANIYVSESAFFTDLVNFLGEADADTYKTVIESAALSVAAVATYSNQVIMNVLWQGNTIPVLTYDISETDTLDAFVLAHSGTTQTLQFVPSIIPTLTTATFVSSPFHKIDVMGFPYIYNLALRPVFAAAAKAVGKAGVALPRIQGFNFLFDNATINLEQGYASVLTDVMHTNDNGALYFQSKRRLQPAESNGAATAATRKNWSAMPPERPLPPLPAEWSHLNQGR